MANSKERHRLAGDERRLVALLHGYTGWDRDVLRGHRVIFFIPAEAVRQRQSMTVIMIYQLINYARFAHIKACDCFMHHHGWLDAFGGEDESFFHSGTHRCPAVHALANPGPGSAGRQNIGYAAFGGINGPTVGTSEPAGALWSPIPYTCSTTGYAAFTRFKLQWFHGSYGQ